MPLPSSPELRVLVALRLSGLIEPDAIQAGTGVPVDEAEGILRQAEAQGHTRYREGRLHGWALTLAGREYGERLLAAELDGSGKREVVEATYRSFLVLNPGFLALCTDWQLRHVNGVPVVNDHTDAVYDEECRDRLVGIDQDVLPVVATLAGEFERFSSYPARFEQAVSAVRAGNDDFFTSPAVDSYHSVWFELHENLLATLNLERSKEGASH